MFIADRIISAVGEHSVPPTLAPIKVPQLVTSENRLDRILVHVDGRPVGTTETVTDVGQLAVQQYQAIYPHVLARAVARRAVKKAAVYAVKEQVDGLNVWASLAMDAAGVVWEATESADTRCWTLLPDKIQVLRVELPAGQHRIALRPAQGQIPLASRDGDRGRHRRRTELLCPGVLPRRAFCRPNPGFAPVKLGKTACPGRCDCCSKLANLLNLRPSLRPLARGRRGGGPRGQRLSSFVKSLLGRHVLVCFAGCPERRARRLRETQAF